MNKVKDKRKKDRRQRENRSRGGKSSSKIEEGIIKRHPDGFGFFIADNPEQEDAYITRPHMSDVMTGDHVAVELFPDPSRPNRWRGKIKKILKRNTKQIVGLYHSLNNNEGIVLDDSHAWGEDIKISINDSLGARENQLVAVEIVTYPGEKVGLRGRVVSVIGCSSNASTDTMRVLLASNIPTEFSSRVKKECEKFSINTTVDNSILKAEFSKQIKRKDLRDIPFITIDGVTAKDFDDAIFVEEITGESNNGNEKGFLLQVAIADVSHYVKKDTSLDDEAYERGTSVYFPGHVTPMLPEALSNELCSLKPNVARLALVCEMKIDYSGEILNYKFYEGVIRSHARVTYGQAQDVIDSQITGQNANQNDSEAAGEENEIDEEISKFPEAAIEVIKKAHDLSKVLLGKRQQSGTLDFNIPESEVLINDQGEPVDIVRSERVFSNRLIEELMLAANVCSAKFLEDKNLEAIYRIHESPNFESIQALERYMYNFGGKNKLTEGNLQKKITTALKEFADKPGGEVLNMLALRSMNQAKYSNENIGHFGLGFSHYTHFTSPIRRYPDLIVHRLIKAACKVDGYSHKPSAGDLESMGSFLSSCEQRAVKAERRFVSIKKARFMNKFVGESFEGMISSVTKFGIFVLLRKYEVDGRISLEDLDTGGRKDYWVFDEEHLCLRGKKSGKVYNIGDTVTVIVAKADADEGKIDFTLNADKNLEENDESKGKDQSRKKSKSNSDRLGKIIDDLKSSGDKKLAVNKHGKTDRPNNKKRRKAKKNSRSVRKARV